MDGLMGESQADPEWIMVARPGPGPRPRNRPKGLFYGAYGPLQCFTDFWPALARVNIAAIAQLPVSIACIEDLHREFDVSFVWGFV